MMGKCEHGLTSKECYVCASPKYGDDRKASMTTEREINLPPLPPIDCLQQGAHLWGAPAMYDYARAAVIADRAARDKDAERLDWFTKAADRGWAPNLVFDDDGRWAVSSAGTAPIPEEGGFKETVSIVSFVDPDEWHDSPRAAIDAALSHVPD